MIRMLEEKDIQACLNIYNRYIRESSATFEIDELTFQQFQDRVHAVTERYPWIVLEEDGRIKGYAYLSAFHPRAAYLWTCDLSIYLDFEERGHGIGSKLMQAILNLAAKDGYVCIASLITEGNTASEHIHEKFGFEKIGFLAKTGYKNGKWYGVTYYLKQLNEPEDVPVPPLNIKL